MYPIKAITIINDKMTTPRLDQFMLSMEKKFKEGKVLQDAKFHELVLIHESSFYNMLTTSCSLEYLCPKKSPYGVVVRWLRILTFQFESPHTCNLGYLGYLGDLIG